MVKINIMIIGLGRHAKRIHLPMLKYFKKKYPIKIKSVIELCEKERETKEVLKKYGFKNTRFIGVTPKGFNNYKLNPNIYKKLEKFIKKDNINVILISCDDKFHKTYIKLALKNNNHLLVEKPLFTKEHSSTSEKNAKEILEDYIDISNLYKQTLKKIPSLVFSVIAQRRYHPAFNLIKKEILDVYKITNCPVTSSQLYHSDGQWRMPNEVLEESYHGYNKGYGKCSHSGYHFFDVLSQIMKIFKNDKKPTHVVSESNFIRPNDFLTQINIKDYKKIFNNFKLDNEKVSLVEKTKEYGEIDAHVTYKFYNNSRILSYANVSLLHNGFSNRSWIDSKKDLYKGNGRLRHEFHIFNQGPFQSIHYHSYQSDEENNKKIKKKKNTGGRLHFEIFIFRNAKILRNNKPQFEKIGFNDLKMPKNANIPRGHQEYSKYLCLKEFLDSVMEGKENSSNYLDHYHSNLLYALAYISASREFNNKNKTVRYKW